MEVLTRNARAGRGHKTSPGMLTGADRQFIAADFLLDQDLHAPILRLADTLGGLDEQSFFAFADHGGCLGGDTLTHERVLDHVARHSDRAIL